MRTKTKTLVLAMTAGLLATGAVHAQKDPADGVAPAGPSNGAPLSGSITGQTCAGSGGSNCPAAIPDATDIPGVLISSFDVLNCTEVVDVNVGIDTAHTWVGDLIYTVTSPAGTSVTVYDRPGVPLTTFGCSGEDILAVLNDSAVAPVEDECALATPTIDGIFLPNNSLAAFNGDLGNGAWTVEVSDNAGADTGTLNDWSLDLVCLNQADLAVTKSITAGAPIAGTQMTYTVEVSNAGPANAVDVVVTDTLPAGTTFVSTSGCTNDNDGVPTCSLGGIATGATATYDITVSIDASVAAGATLSNLAEVNSATDDPNGTNNSFTLNSTATRVAPITVTKTQTTSNPIVAGQGGSSNLCYNVNVANAGPSDVTGLVVTDTGAAYPGITMSLNQIPPTINLAPASDADYAVCFTVAASAAEGTFTNTAAATGSAGGEDLGDPANHTDSVNTAITRVVDITVVKTGPANVTAGSGAGNLAYVVTVTNNGPSDVTGLGILDAITGPASGGLINVSGTGATFYNLAAGANTAFNVTGTVVLAAVEGETITNTASVTGSTGGEQIINQGDDSDFVVTTIDWPTATFNVDKLYNGGTGASVPVMLDCSDSTGLGFGDPVSGNTDTALVWRRFDHNTGTTCSVVETVPAGFFEMQRTADCDIKAVADDGVYNCTLTNAETVARFHVTKIFSDGSMDDVNVTLTCDTGLPLTQNLTIAGGDPTGVTFVVTDYVDGTMSCAVTEVTNTPGYDVEKSGCEWNLVQSIDSPFGCIVNNEAQDATFTVNKVWDIINTGGEVIDTRTPVTIWCDSEITTAGAYYSGSAWYLSGTLDDGDSLTATVKTTTGAATCWAVESVTESAVEATDDCGKPSTPNLVAGGSDSCTFYNTVFFEGIPTLSQYGLAILALLMLGVGMVGFRRFV